MLKPVKALLLSLVGASSLTACQNQSMPLNQNNALRAQTAQNPAASAEAQVFPQLAPGRVGFEQFQIVRTVSGKNWPKMELLRTPGLPDERMQERGRQRDPDVISCFGSEIPAGNDICLHDAGEPTKRVSDVPVLLIHGANVNATNNWVEPPYSNGKPGLMQHLRGQGYRVFAISFGNKHGDNFVWVNQIHNAIQRVRQITGAPKVDAVAHSKGGFALRMYTSDILAPGQTQPYPKAIRKALFIGSPHRGLDYTFRHPVVHWALLPEKDEAALYAPLAWTRALIYGKWVDAERNSFVGPYFKGQAQMMARWDDVYGLDKLQPDWYTTYNGGQGFVSKSPGIDSVIKSSGNVVGQLRRSGVDPSIAVGVLAGNKANMPGILNENAGPSDGLVFVQSAGAAEDLTTKGARLLDKTVLPVHHMGLVFEQTALNWVSAQLQK